MERRNEKRRFGKFNSRKTHRRQEKQMKTENSRDKCEKIDGETRMRKKNHKRSIAASNKVKKLWRAMIRHFLK